MCSSAREVLGFENFEAVQSGCWLASAAASGLGRRPGFERRIWLGATALKHADTLVIGMLAKQEFSSRTVPFPDRVNDRVVKAVRPVQHVKGCSQTNLVKDYHRRRDEWHIVEPVNESGKQWRLASLDHEAVETFVHQPVLLLIVEIEMTLLEQRVALSQTFFKFGEHIGIDTLLGEIARCPAFEQRAHFERIEDFAFTEIGNYETALAYRLKETLGCKPWQNIADRRSGYAQPLGERRFGDPFAGPKLFAQDHFFEGVL